MNSTESESWRRMAEGLELDAEAAELRGYDRQARLLREGAAEARQLANTGREKDEQVVDTKYGSTMGKDSYQITEVMDA